MIERVKANREKIIVVLGIAAFYAFLFIIGVGCPIKWTTGISCMGCGMSRAVWSAVRLRFQDAFYYHPLWVILPVWVVIYFCRKKINPKVFRALIWITIAAFMVVYVIRMFDGHNHVVVFEPNKSIIIRLIIH